MTYSDVAPGSTEFLATVAARQLVGLRRVFAGVGLPTLAVDLALRTVNPNVELVYESGVCGAHPDGLAEGIADSVLVTGAEAVLSMHALFGYVLQGGHVDVGFLGAAQVDRFGSLNTTFIGDWEKPTVRLPGAGGAAEIVPNAGECIVVLRRHDPGALPAKVDFCTSPSPVRAREEDPRMVPPGHGVSTVITPLAVLRRPDKFGELQVSEVHPGVTVDEVRAATGWDIVVADDVRETERPTVEDVRLLREEIDTVRLYLR
ncbi:MULTISPECIES: CoA-transferase subunit beta [unclassified Nocardioides]|uniref:CoA-transferase subunit beta n=1 Tax=unclassified Nocardioides TaxID=2615069 RepID=UPI0006FAD0F7|nr:MULTISPECIES: CoA-transferase [unclassified Nocardioides]KQY50114.1 3-oxoadipate--succinyl-CoA transferase [Nocardioides sp. Root140]KQZ75738.1 3-oxoadipate--succinyl-CoA transferase [Nocardioides sp. Root151]